MVKYAVSSKVSGKLPDHSNSRILDVHRACSQQNRMAASSSRIGTESQWAGRAPQWPLAPAAGGMAWKLNPNVFQAVDLLKTLTHQEKGLSVCFARTSLQCCKNGKIC